MASKKIKVKSESIKTRSGTEFRFTTGPYMISHMKNCTSALLFILIFSSAVMAQSIIINKNDNLFFNEGSQRSLHKRSVQEKEKIREKDKGQGKEGREEEDKGQETRDKGKAKEDDDEEKFDEPNKFFEYEQMIRTRDGEKTPSYSPNYQVSELNKAIRNARLLKTAQPLNWIERGPGNVSGRTRGILIDSKDVSGETWFAGSVGGGIWKTTDMGYNWTNQTPELPNLATTVLSQSASNPDIIYCGTGEGFWNIDAVNGAGIFKSTDHGNTWSQLQSTSNFNFYCINRIIVDPSNPNILLACTRSAPDRENFPGGIHRSTDGGMSWTRVFSTIIPNGVQDLQADPDDFLIQYAAIYGTGVIRSTDGGVSWGNLGTGINALGRIEIAISRKNSNYIYAGAETSDGSALYLSKDRGQTWNQIKYAYGPNPNWLGGQGWYDNTIAVSPYNENVVFFAGIDIWKADLLTDGSNSADFTPMTDAYGAYGRSYVHPDHHSLVMIPKDPADGTFWIVNGNDGGVAVSTDGGYSWRETLSGGYNTTQFYGIDKKPGANEYIGGTQDNGTWLSPSGEDPDKTTEYKMVIGGDGFETAWHYKDPLKIIGSSQYNNFRRSTDGGLSWMPVSESFTDEGEGKGPFISKIAKSNTDPDVIFTTGSKGIWRSENFGASWDLCTIASGTWSYSMGATPVAVSIADPQIVWAGAAFSNASSSLFLSDDGGLIFKSVKPYTGAALGRITGIFTHPADPKTAYLTFSMSGAPKILRTTDLGNSWQDISGFDANHSSSNGFPNVATYCVIQMPYNPNILWAGTEIGLFESLDNGQSWHYANNGLPAVCIWDMRITDDQVILATHGRGIYSVTLSELNGYKPPAATLSPLLTNLGQGPDGALIVQADFRSAYDSVLFVIDSKTALRLANTAATQSLQRFVIPVPCTASVQLSAYKDGKVFSSISKTVQMVQVKPPRITYYNNFNKISNDFTGSFRVSKPEGFSSLAIHSPHPYTVKANYTYSLLYPIKIDSGDPFIEYDDIAIVEPGDPGKVFGDEEFWDYVVVEASNNGYTWVPLEDGYDCKFNPVWKNIWDTYATPDSESFIHHKINMLNKFNDGDVVFIRFRLYSDEALTGWGWAIDNVSIQSQLSDVRDKNEIPASYSLMQNYPNPFNPSTTISYALSQKSHVELKIYDMLGREVSTLVDKEQSAGKYKLQFDASSLPSGMYIYRIKAGQFMASKKLLLVK